MSRWDILASQGSRSLPDANLELPSSEHEEVRSTVERPSTPPTREDIDALRRALAALPTGADIEAVRERLSALPTTTDLRLIFEALLELKGRVDGQAHDRLETPPRDLDLAPVLEHLEALETALIEGSLAERLEALTRAVESADIHPMLEQIKAQVEDAHLGDEVRAVPDLVLGPVLQRIDDLSDRVDPEVVSRKLDEIAGSTALADAVEDLKRSLDESVGRLATSADQAAVRDEIASLRVALTEGPLAELLERLVEASDRAADASTVDLQPVLERIDALQAADAQPVLDRLDELARATDPAPVLSEIASLHAALTSGPLAELLQELAGSQNQLAVLEDLASLRDELASRPAGDTAELLAGIEHLKDQLGHTAVHEEVRALPSLVLKPVLARLDALANVALEQSDVRDRLVGLADGVDQLRAAVGETALEQLDGVAAQLETLQVTLEELPAMLAEALTNTLTGMQSRPAGPEGADRSDAVSLPPAAESEAIESVNARLEAMEERIDTLIDAVFSRLEESDGGPSPVGLAEMELQMAEMAAAVTALRKRVALRGRMDSAVLSDETVDLIADAVSRRLNPAPTSGSKRWRRRSD